MKSTYLLDFAKRKPADALLLPYWEGKDKPQPAFALSASLADQTKNALATGDFKGKEGETLFLYPNEKLEKRLCLVGIGKKESLSTEGLRKSFGAATQACLAKKLPQLTLVLPEKTSMEEEELFRGLIEGICLPNHSPVHYKSVQEEKEGSGFIQAIQWVISGAKEREALFKKTFERVFCVCQSLHLACDWVNENADVATPEYLGRVAHEIAKSQAAIQAHIMDKKQIKKENLGLLLAVSRGSLHDPVFIVLEYRGRPKSKEKVVLVGKGVTYDTGGLNLKPTGSMETMKCDMAGAAACLAVISCVAQLQMRVNLSVVIPATENGIDAASFKPGDVYHSYSGKSVEMTNSDAEGRLILADALAYAAEKLKPTEMIDIATLTGAIEIALGSEAAGLMSPSDSLAHELIEAGEKSGERLWRMPLFNEYRERLKSDIADLKSWNGRGAGANVAATFLRQFVPDTIRWAHLDIAGTAYLLESKKYLPKYATGFGVRLLVEFLSKKADQ